MATRVYFPEATAAPVTVTPPGGWVHDSGVRRKLAIRTPGTSTLVTTDYAPDTADDVNPGASLLRQYVSDPLSAQTISGTLIGQVQCLEDNAGNNLGLAVRVYTVSTDGSTVTHTLTGLTQQGTEINTTLRNQSYLSIPLTSATIAAGERLVVEIGLGGTPVATGGVQGHNGQIRWGETASSGDLPVDNTTTATTFRGWVEFSATIGLFVQPATMPEALAVTESTRKVVTKTPLTETVALTDTPTLKQLRKAPTSEALGLFEQLTPVVTILPPGGPGLTHWAFPHFADAHWTLGHWAAVARPVVQEVLGLAEQLRKAVTTAPLTEALALTETRTKAVTRSPLTEALALTDGPLTPFKFSPSAGLYSHWGYTTGRQHWAAIHWRASQWIEGVKPPLQQNTADALGLSEALVAQKYFPLPPPEGLTVAETPLVRQIITSGERIFVTIPEAFGLTEGLAGQKYFPLPPAEGLAVTEAVKPAQKIPRTITESLALATETLTSPSLVAGLGVSHWADAHWTAKHWLEVPVAALVIPRLVTESLGVAEALTKRVSVTRTLAEALPLSESLNKQATRTLTEALVVVEAQTKRVARGLTEPLALAEAVHASFALHLAETLLPLTESLARTGFVIVAVGDLLPLSESLTRGLRKAASDALALTETLIKALPRTLAGEALGLTEQLTETHTRALTVTLAGEALGLSEQLTRLGITARLLPEALGVTEVLTRRLTLLRPLTEGLGLEEGLLRDGQDLVLIRHYVIVPPVRLDGSTTAPRIVVNYTSPERIVVADEEGILV